MEAGCEEGDGDGKGRLLWLGCARGHFCRRHGNVRGDAVEFGLLLNRVLRQRAIGRVYGDGLQAEGSGQPEPHAQTACSKNSPGRESKA